MAKKRDREKREKREVSPDQPSASNGGGGGEGSHSESLRKCSKEKRNKSKSKSREEKHGIGIPTVSIAVPGSILDNCQSHELATRVAGQIARAVTIFRIDEVVVFDNKSTPSNATAETMEDVSEENENGASFLMRILRYLETPQYLRKSLFPKHHSLRFAGLLPPLDAPHHARKHEWTTYREGITLEKVGRGSAGTLVDVGLSKYVTIDQDIEPGKRVTVEMGTNRNLDSGPLRKIVPSSRLNQEGVYWGYKARYALNFSSVFNDCPYQGGYDYLIGTSEHGTTNSSSELTLPAFRHLLIAFGGLAGLEECAEEDANLKDEDVREIFNLYLNTCPHQGSRTIRTEEAILISLQYFQEPINRVMHKYNPPSPR